jgi:hypothetical protein
MKYVLLGNLSPEWASKQSERVGKAKAKLDKLGIKIESIHYTQGYYDFVDIVDAPNPEANAISPAHRAFAERAGSRDAMTKITDVHIARLLPRRESRTSLRRSHRSRKQNQPGLRRLRSERYPYR